MSKTYVSSPEIIDLADTDTDTETVTIILTKEARRMAEKDRCDRIEARLNKSNEELAHDDAIEKLEHFKSFVNRNTDCDRSERFYAYYHFDSDLHVLQHQAFLEVFGIEDIMHTEETQNSGETPQIVKYDDTDNPTVVIERQNICHDGVLVGVFYRGVRLEAVA